MAKVDAASRGHTPGPPPPALDASVSTGDQLHHLAAPPSRCSGRRPVGRSGVASEPPRRLSHPARQTEVPCRGRDHLPRGALPVSAVLGTRRPPVPVGSGGLRVQDRHSGGSRLAWRSTSRWYLILATLGRSRRRSPGSSDLPLRTEGARIFRRRGWRRTRSCAAASKPPSRTVLRLPLRCGGPAAEVVVLLPSPTNLFFVVQTQDREVGVEAFYVVGERG